MKAVSYCWFLTLLLFFSFFYCLGGRDDNNESDKDDDDDDGVVMEDTSNALRSPLLRAQIAQAQAMAKHQILAQNQATQPPARVDATSGLPWVPLHVVGDPYLEEVTGQKHCTVLLDLPSGVATDNTENITVSLSNGGNTLTVRANWPGIMKEEGLLELHSRWVDKGVSMLRMMFGLDQAIMGIRQQMGSREIAGIFMLDLPFAAERGFKKTWICNQTECCLLHIDLAMATIDDDLNPVEQFQQVQAAPVKRAGRKEG